MTTPVLIDRVAPTPPASEQPVRPGRAPRWNRIDVATVLVLAAVAAVLGFWNIGGAPAFQDDEGTYASQAWAVRTLGQLAPYTYWYDHPPLGWIQLAAVGWVPEALGLGGGSSIAQMRYVIGAVFVLNVVLLYLLTRRLGMARWLGVVTCAMFALSPLSLLLGRQVFLDNVATPWLLGAFLLALSPSRNMWHHLMAGLLLAVAVLSKETTLVVAPALLVATVYSTHPRNRVFSLVGFGLGAALPMAMYPAFAMLRGELLPGPGHVSLWDAVMFQLVERAGSGAVWEPGSARAALVGSWEFYDQALLVGGLALALLCLARRELRFVPVALLGLAIPVLKPGGYLPAMYVAAALPFLALGVGGGLSVLWRSLDSLAGARRRVSQAALAVVLAVVAVSVSVPGWVDRDREILTAQANAPWYRMTAWVQQNLPRESRVLTDNTVWLDLVRSGWGAPWDGAIWHYKLDLDTAAAAELPQDWRSLDYVISSPTMRADVENLGLTKVGLALENSRVVAQFGGYEIRRVQK
jgi:4-amino-4-deoxy-L-arabinose transferase-like glycosyltransferase